MGALRALAVMTTVATLAACGDPAPATGEPSGDALDPAGGPPDAADSQGPATAPPPTDACIRGGTTRAEVLAIMGEPDSIVFGAWMYGPSNITFGYGAVLDFSNDGDNLRLCD